MKRLLRSIVPMALLGLLATTASFAQGPGGSGGGQFGQFREQHKYTFQLMQMVRHIGDIDKEPKYAVTAAQAKKVSAVLKPLRGKAQLTQDQAKSVLKDLKPIFTIGQLNAMAKIKPRPRSGGHGGGGQGMGRPGGFGGPRMGGPGMGRPGGGGLPGPGGRMGMDPASMKNFNPFYKNPKPVENDRGARGAKRWDTFFSALDARSKGSKAPLSIEMKPGLQGDHDPGPGRH